MRNSNPSKNTPNLVSRNPQLPASILRDIETTIPLQVHLPGTNNCVCQLCQPHRFPQAVALEANLFRKDDKKSLRLLKRMLEGLTDHIAKTLKLYLPDILFIEEECVEIYQTHRRQGRIYKVPGSTLLKNIYPTFLKMRKQYKFSLQQKHNQQMLDKVNPEFMHVKYYSKLLPSNFTEANNSKTLELNKYHFRKYILHNNTKFQIAALEEHKLNDKEPFCIVRYKDGNCQLLNQHEFEIFTFANPQKMQEEVAYFQSYIKYKQQSESILYSQFDCAASLIDAQMDLRAQRQVMIMFEAIDKYSLNFQDLQTLDEQNVELMLTDQPRYVKFMTYKIVNYLTMASSIYISHLKIKWILNDIGNIYLQEIMEVQTSEFPTKIVRFRLQRHENINFYKENEFVDIYKEMKKKKVINTLIIKRQIDKKTYKQLLNLIDPSAKDDSTTLPTENHSLRKSHLPVDHSPIGSQDQDYAYHSARNRKGGLAVSRRSKVLSKTIDVRQVENDSILSRGLNQMGGKARGRDLSSYEQHLKRHPQIVMKNINFDSSGANRYSLVPDKMNRVNHNINNHFRFNMSVQDRKAFSKPPRNSIDRNEPLKSYLQKKEEKAAASLLYTTFFHQLHHRKASLYDSIDHHNSPSSISPR